MPLPTVEQEPAASSSREALLLTDRDLLPSASELANRRRNHLGMLLVAAAVTVLSFALRVVDREYIAFRGFPQQRLPHTCFSRAMLHVDCPACGLTRSFILLAEGRVAESFARHHLGLLLAGAVLFQFPYRGLCIWGPEREWIPRPWRKAFSFLLIGMLLGNWIFKLLVPGW